MNPKWTMINYSCCPFALFTSIHKFINSFIIHRIHISFTPARKMSAYRPAFCSWFWSTKTINIIYFFSASCERKTSDIAIISSVSSWRKSFVSANWSGCATRKSRKCGRRKLSSGSWRRKRDASCLLTSWLEDADNLKRSVRCYYFLLILLQKIRSHGVTWYRPPFRLL